MKRKLPIFFFFSPRWVAAASHTHKQRASKAIICPSAFLFFFKPYLDCYWFRFTLQTSFSLCFHSPTIHTPPAPLSSHSVPSLIFRPPTPSSSYLPLPARHHHPPAHVPSHKRLFVCAGGGQGLGAGFVDGFFLRAVITGREGEKKVGERQRSVIICISTSE